MHRANCSASLGSCSALTSVGFARVRVIADDVPPDAGVLEVVLAHGERVVIRAGASGDLVRQVVSALRASC